MIQKHLPLVAWIFIAFAAAHIFTGCSGDSINAENPEVLMKDAEDDIKGDRYTLAIEKLRIVKNKFPYSSQSVAALLRMADVYFMQESFAEAGPAYESFRDLHPKNEKIPYALFRIGESYYNDMPSTAARDMGSGNKALEAFQVYVEKCPTDLNIETGKKRILETKAKLAEKELYIANFYYHQDFYESAKARYLKMIGLYPDSEQAKEAREKLAYVEKSIEKGTPEVNSHGSKRWKIEQ
jgi:outer membrane protein assembly factor BamD